MKRRLLVKLMAAIGARGMLGIIYLPLVSLPVQTNWGKFPIRLV